jgi:hypothetical protein
MKHMVLMSNQYNLTGTWKNRIHWVPIKYLANYIEPCAIYVTVLCASNKSIGNGSTATASRIRGTGVLSFFLLE